MPPSNNIEEYLCPICREILIQPVKLPCKHTCCNECLEQTLDSNKYQCFMCRKFIGSWYRNAKRKKTLINEKLWKTIRDKFKDVVDRKLSGESVDIITSRFPTKLSLPGEIKQEFEVSAQQLLLEDRVKREKEEKLSEELIKKLQEEEEEYRKKQEELAMLDEELAKNLADELNADVNSRIEEELTQLSEDEKIARTLEKLEQNSPRLKSLNTTSRSHAKTPIQKTPQRRVAVGPLDRFLGTKRTRNL